MSRMAVIVNPVARRYEQVGSSLVRLLEEQDLDFKLWRTEAPGQAIDLAMAAVERGFDVVVAAGGNGTCNQVVTGLMQSQSLEDKAGAITFGIIPLGLGNEFARSAGIPLSLPEACRSLGQGRTKLLDIGQVRLPDGRIRFFISTAGIGFNGKVAFAAEEIRWPSFWPMFLWLTVKSVALYNQATDLEIEFDGQRIIKPCLMVVIANGKFEGMVFRVAPEAELNDGLFDLLLVSEMSRFQILRFIPIFMKGKQAGEKQVSFFKIRHLRISSETELAVHLDGEILAPLRELEFEILPGCLRLIGG